MELSLHGFLNVLIPSLRTPGSTVGGADVHTEQTLMLLTKREAKTKMPGFYDCLEFLTIKLA